MEPWKKKKLALMKTKLKFLSLASLKLLKTSLDSAVNISARINIPPLKGRTVIFCAYGFESNERMTAGKGLQQGGTTVRDTCLLYSTMITRRAEDSTLILFSDTHTKVELASPDLLTNISTITDSMNGSPIMSAWTRVDCLTQCVEEYIRKGTVIDNIIVFHSYFAASEQPRDCRKLLHILDVYRQELNTDLVFSCIDVTGKTLKTQSEVNAAIDTNKTLSNQDEPGNTDKDWSVLIFREEESAIDKEKSADQGSETADQGPKTADPRNVFLTGSSDVMLKFLLSNGNGNLISSVEMVDKKFSLDRCTHVRFFPSPLEPVLKYPEWRTIKIFISSTFLDMQGERNLLHHYVIPTLQKKCRDLYIKVDLVDLRWGLVSDTLGSSQVESCLQQVQQAHFFIGILGERYGWVPSYQQRKLSEPLGSEVGSILENETVSITELEMHLGALSRPEDSRDRAFFYLRDPGFMEYLPEDARALFGTAQPKEQQGLELLKERIRKSGLDVFDGYKAAYGGNIRGAYVAVELQEFGERVISNLWNSIQALYPPMETSSTHAMQTCLSEQLSGCSKVAASFVGRKKDIANIQKSIEKVWTEERAGSVVRLISAPGTGCTAVLQYIAHMYSSSGVQVVCHTQEQGTIHKNARGLLQYILFSLNNKQTAQKGVEELKLSIRQHLQQHKGKLIIVMNRLGLVELDWMPETLPPGVIILTRCLPEERTQRFSQNVLDIKIGFLDLRDRADYLRSMLARVGKALEEKSFTNQVLDIVHKTEGGSPTFLNTLVNRLIRHTTFNTLAQDISSAGSTLKELFLQQLDLGVLNAGAQATAALVRVLYLSNYGLHLSELQTVLSFLLYGGVSLSRVTNTESTRKLINTFSTNSVLVYPTLELVSLLSSLDGLVCHSGGLYFIPAGQIRTFLLDKYIKPGKQEDLRSIRVILAAWGLQAYAQGYTQPHILKSLAQHVGSLDETRLLRDLLCSPAYCQTMCSAGLVGRFLDQLQGDSIKLARSRQRFVSDPLVESWIEFVQEHMGVLGTHPQLCIQLLVNQPSNSPIFKHFIQSKDLGSVPTKLIEWVNRGEERRGGRVINRKEDKYPTVVHLFEHLVFVGYSDGVIAVISSETFREGVSFIGHTEEITGLALVGGDTLLSIAADGGLASWDLRNKIRLQSVLAHTGRATGLVSRNYNTVTVGWDGCINLWSKGLQRLSQISVNHVPLNDVVLHPFKNYVIVGAWDKSVRVFDLDSKEQKAKLASGSSVQKIAISGNANQLAAGSLNGDVEIWDGSKGVLVSKINLNSIIKSLQFSSDGQLLVGTANGCIQGINYGEGARLKSPVTPVKMRIAARFADAQDMDKLRDATSLRRCVSALSVITDDTTTKSLYVLGFDNGDVQCYNTFNCPAGKLNFGWNFGEEPICSIDHKMDFNLGGVDWSEEESNPFLHTAIYVHSKRSAAVHGIFTNRTVYLDGLESDIVSIFLTDVGFEPRIVVLTEYKVYVYQGKNYNLSSEDVVAKTIRPIKSYSLGQGSRWVRAVETGKDEVLAVTSSGELWCLQVEAEELKANFTEITAPSSDADVVAVLFKELSPGKGKAKKYSVFVFCGHGTVLRVVRDHHNQYTLLDQYIVNTSGVLQVHSHTASEFVGVLHSCGRISLWSPRGVEVGCYQGSYTGAWVFDNLLYAGSETLQLFDPAVPNLIFAQKGHKDALTSLAVTAGSTGQFLSAAKDGAIKHWRQTTRTDLIPSIPSALVCIEEWRGEVVLALTKAGQLTLKRRNQDSLEVVFSQMIETNALCMRVVELGDLDFLVVVSRTKICFYRLFQDHVEHAGIIDQSETALGVLRLWVSEAIVVCTMRTTFGTLTRRIQILAEPGSHHVAISEVGREFTEEYGVKACDVLSLNPEDIASIKGGYTVVNGLAVTEENRVIKYGEDGRLKIYQFSTDGSSLYQIGEFDGSGGRLCCLTVTEDCMYAGDEAGIFYQLRVIN